jgi:hypothetical protein
MKVGRTSHLQQDRTSGVQVRRQGWRPKKRNHQQGMLRLKSRIIGPLVPKNSVSGRVARPFGSGLTDPGRRLSRTPESYPHGVARASGGE